MKKIGGYLRGDFERAFCTPIFLLGMIGVYFSYFFSIYKMATIEGSVLHMFVMSIYFIPFILTLTFSVFPFGGVFCEELENGFYYLEMIRGNLKYYVVSKIFTISLSAIMTMMLGTLLFVLTLRFQMPWIDINDVTYQTIIESGSLVFLLEGGHYITYFVLYSFKLGLLAANLSVLAGFLSLFWKRKFFVFSIPFLFYYLQVYFWGNIFSSWSQLNLMSIYNSYFNVWKNEIFSFVWALFFHFIFLIGFGYAGYRKLKRRLWV